MSFYWVFSEKQLEEAMQAHYQAAVARGELTEAEAGLLGGAVREFLFGEQLRAMDMRRGESVQKAAG
ncbi:MAG TPA: hypothetical protein VNJ47_12120 [Nevskiales bacterium]|nr:hypothetical protein [Nevskiales bacterium]